MSEFSTYLLGSLALFFGLLFGFVWVYLIYYKKPTRNKELTRDKKLTRNLFSVEAISYILVSAILSGIVLILIRGFGLLETKPINNFVVAASYLAAFILGSLFGIAELISRYRDEPKRALLSWAAFLYIFVNALASVFALNLIRVFGWFMDGEPLQNAYKQILVAGLGAMALFRSSLFIFRVGKSEINFGPVYVLEILLGVADRAVDRGRGWARSADVGEIMQNVSFEKAQELLPAYCLALMQNLSREEQEVLATEITSVKAITITDPIAANRQKSVMLRLKLLSVVGTDLLEQAVKELGNDIRTNPLGENIGN
ncbi:MAG: hypothetical protein M3Q33_06625 [Acidobacteriota bacterium]|nr:hypothetical protein [Acidobacteriota bacterium]